ncbi:hypothetical protein NGA_0367800, partial [Nannochloropsis gaditana CCMP526]
MRSRVSTSQKVWESPPRWE